MKFKILPCPFAVKGIAPHQTSRGCEIREYDGYKEHHYHSVRASVDREGEIFCKTIDVVGAAIQREFHLDGRVSITLPLIGDCNQMRFITEIIDSSRQFWQIFRLLLQTSDEITNQIRERHGLELYMDPFSISDVIYLDDKLIFMRPLLFTTNRQNYFTVVKSLFRLLYQSFIANITPETHPQYFMSFSDRIAKEELIGKRNQVRCTLDHHRSRALFHEFKCNPGCPKTCNNSGGGGGGGGGGGLFTLDGGKGLCYGCLPVTRRTKEVKEQQKNDSIMYGGGGGGGGGGDGGGSHSSFDKSFEYECIFENKKPGLHYELFGRMENMHRIFCCPNAFLCEEWYRMLREEIEKQFIIDMVNNELTVDKRIKDLQTFWEMSQK